MGIKYYKLFDMLNRKGMKKSDLRQVISSATVAKLSKGEYISGEAIEKICMFLHCQPGDIMEVIKDEDTLEDGTAVYTTRETENDSIEGLLNVTAVNFRNEETGTLILKDSKYSEDTE